MAASKVKKSRFFENSFVSKLMNRLDEQRKCSRFCDVVLKVCDTSIRVHSNILAAASPYFHAFLGQGEDDPRAFSQNTPQIIEIHIDNTGDKDSYGEAVCLIVDYFYSGKITVTSNIINHIAEISKIMCLYKLTAFCEWFQKEGGNEDDISDVSEKHLLETDETQKKRNCNQEHAVVNHADKCVPIVS